MQAKLFGSAIHGVEAFRITIEVSVEKGIGVRITGLPDDGIKESYNRIAVALTAHGFQMPRTKLVINLAPADVRKTGTAFDLPIAIGILLASEQLYDMDKLKDYVIVGELGLDGGLYPVRGALCMAWQAKQDGYKGIILPYLNAEEASLVEGIEVIAIHSLSQIIEFVQADFAHPTFIRTKPSTYPANSLDFSQVVGQAPVKRALEIAAAGGHNTLMSGSPGSSKSMLAKRMPSILPPMTLSECIETTRIYSVTQSGLLSNGLITQRPFRQPHHTCSDVSLTGGGSMPMQGEISLAHNGLLFLDELGEFKRNVLEALRQPLEDRKVLISRAKSSLEFPASFMLLAAMNPCICGYHGHPTVKCTCSKAALYWYRRKFSGPFMERIDMQIEVDPVPIENLLARNNPEESSASIRERVIKAREIQTERFKNLPGIYCNAHIPESEIQNFCELEPAAKKYLWQQMDRLQLSARSFSRILKVARTIADLYATTQIELAHIAEAIHYRKLDQPLHHDKPNVNPLKRIV